jgi:hypothetical protein
MRATIPLLFAAMTGCTHWVPANLPPAVVLAPREQPLRSIRIRLDDSSRLVLHDHLLRGDSVVGYLKSRREPGARAPGVVPLAVRLGAIREVQLRRVSPVRTGLLGAGIAASAALLVAMRDFSCCRVAIPCGLLGEPCAARTVPR